MKNNNNNNDIEKFSVLMSVYYKEDANDFDLALESILIEQTRIPDEFVLICDGKITSELDKIIAKYYNQFSNIFKVYRLPENVGLGKALRYGINKCSYDLIARADSDDICVNNRFEIQLKFMQDNLDIAAVGGYIDEFEDNASSPIRIKKMPLTHEELVKFSKLRNPLNHMTVMFRKNIIIKIGSYNHILYMEDYELWIRLIKNNYKIANIDKILVHARIGNGMEKRRGNKESIKSWKKLNKYMLENKMINLVEFYRNTIYRRIFVNTPNSIKKLIYKFLLRNK